MKKIITFTLIATLILGMLTACNETKKNSQSETSVNQSQTDDNSDNNSDNDSSDNEESESVETHNGPYVWRTARRGSYENGVWENAGLRYERNLYGLYTAINVYDENGIKIGDNAEIKEIYDDNNRLTKFETGYRTFLFTYGSNGKMSEICVQNEKGNNLVKLTYTADGGYCAIDYNENYTDTYETNIYDEKLNRLSYEKVSNGELQTNLSTSFTYDDSNQLIHKNGYDYEVEYTYDSNDRLIKSVKTETFKTPNVFGTYHEFIRNFVEEYTYSDAGNLLLHTGKKINPDNPDDFELYDFEEYTDADYDEQGRCLYYYEKDSWGKWEKIALSTTVTYEYAEDGSLLRKNWSDGTFVEYDSEGNVVVDKREVLTYGYQKYPIIDDNLLVVFYELFGDDFV